MTFSNGKISPISLRYIILTVSNLLGVGIPFLLLLLLLLLIDLTFLVNIWQLSLYPILLLCFTAIHGEGNKTRQEV